jgi:hypothetical protein
MITREQILALTAVLLFLVFATVAAFVRRIIFRHWKKPDALLENQPALLPWKTEAFADLAWNTSYAHTSQGREIRERRLILSLHEWEHLPESPESMHYVVAGQEESGVQEQTPLAGWLACELVTTVRFLSASRILHLHSSKHKVTLDAPVNFRLGSASRAQITVTGGISGQFRYEGTSVVLSREGSASAVGSWEIGDDTRHCTEAPYYGAVTIKGQKVAALLAPGAHTPALFDSQKTPQLLLQSASPQLTEEQEELLLAFVTMQIYSLMLRTEKLHD